MIPYGKDKILNALIERRGIQYLVDAAAMVLNNPIFVYDLSGKILAKGAPEGMEDVWNVILPAGHLLADRYTEVEQAGIYRQLLNSDQPVWGKFDFCPYRFLGARIREKSTAVGVATMAEVNPCPADIDETMIIICKCLLFEMIYHERTAASGIPYASLLRDLLTGAVNRAEIQERILAGHYEFPHTFVLLEIPGVPQANPLTGYFLRDRLLGVVPDSYSILYHSSLLLLVDSERWTPNVRDTVLNQLPEESSALNQSAVFRDIFCLEEAYRQTQSIRKLRELQLVTDRFTDYDRVRMMALYVSMADTVDLHSYELPVLEDILTYDRTHRTQLFPALEAYLNCGRNMQRAAEQLFWHKNTLYYRLGRLTEQFGLDLSNEQLCFSLQTSYLIRRICTKVQNHAESLE